MDRLQTIGRDERQETIMDPNKLALGSPLHITHLYQLNLSFKQAVIARVC